MAEVLSLVEENELQQLELTISSLMDAAAAVESVSHGTQIAPQSERQARPLTKLEPVFHVKPEESLIKRPGT